MLRHHAFPSILTAEMMQTLQTLWYRGRTRTLIVNAVVGVAAAFVALYVAYSIISNLFDFHFLFGPYGSPDRSSIFSILEIEASDSRWLGMLKGAGNTISVVVFAVALSSLLGLLVGVARLAGSPMISRLGGLYVETFRNLPLLLIMFFFAFGLFRELPGIDTRTGVERVFYVSNRGVAVPWLEGAHDLVWLWLIALAAGIAAGAWIRARRSAQEADTGQSTHPNAWGASVFLAIAVGSYVALLFPVRVTLPDVVQSGAGSTPTPAGTILGWGT